MSNTPPPILPPVPTPDQARSGCLTAFMVVVGIILLLPGLCAIIFGFASLTAPRFDPGFTLLILIGLLVGVSGIMVIRDAIRGPRP